MSHSHSHTQSEKKQAKQQIINQPPTSQTSSISESQPAHHWSAPSHEIQLWVVTEKRHTACDTPAHTPSSFTRSNDGK